jgi:hypothetical protein
MPELHELGRGLILIGLVVVLLGVGLTFADRLPMLGRLPGDFVIRRDGLTCAVPIATSIVISLLLTILLNVLARLGHR